MSEALPEISAPAIDGIPTLPYYPLWSAWSDHVEICSQCAHVIHGTQEQAIEELCWEGRGLNFGIKNQVKQTRETAAWN